MCDIDKIGKSSWLVNQVTAGIGAILSNKYLGGLGPRIQNLKPSRLFWNSGVSNWLWHEPRVRQ